MFFPFLTAFVLYFHRQNLAMRQFLLLLALPLFTFGQNRVFKTEVDETPFRTLQIDQEKMHVSIEFEPEIGKVSGTVQLVFKTLDQPIDSLWIDGINMHFYSVFLNSVGVAYRLKKKGIVITPENPLLPHTRFRLKMEYDCLPQRGVFFVGWDDETGHAPKQMWTQGQGIDHRHWIPHVDAQNDKLITSMTIAFDADYDVVSNGVLEGKTPIGNHKTLWRYSMKEPHSSYLMMLAIGKYGSFQQASTSEIELTNYFYPDWQYRNKWTYYKNQEVFDFLEGEIGVPYPWQNYKQVPVRNFQHGAMENTTATIYGDFFCVDSLSFNDNNYVWANAHELAHQWFGNLVTANGSKDHWLHEGFATYYSALAVRHVFGEDEFRKTMQDAYRQTARAEQHDFYPLAHGKAGSARFYKKGAWVVHMLRNELGEDVFRQAIKNYLQANAYGMVTTNDLQWFLEEESGKDLSQFFKQWVYRSQIPQLVLDVAQNGRLVNVVVSQNLLPNQEPFHLKIPLKIWSHAGLKNGVITMEGDTANYSFELEKGATLMAVVPDPEFDILANWSVNVEDKTMLHNMAVLGHAWTWGMQTYVASKSYDSKSAKAFQKSRLLTRMAYASFLGDKLSSKTELSKQEIKFLKAEDSQDVIKAFLNHTANLTEKIFPIAEKWLEWPSYDIKEKTLVALCVSNPENAKKYLNKIDDVVGTNGHDVRLTWLSFHIALDDENTDKYVKELASYTSPAYDFLTRIKAFNNWKLVENASDEDKLRVAKNAFLAIIQNNRKLRSNAKKFVNTSNWNNEDRPYFQDALNELIAENRVSNLHLMRIENLTGFTSER